MQSVVAWIRRVLGTRPAVEGQDGSSLMTSADPEPESDDRRVDADRREAVTFAEDIDARLQWLRARAAVVLREPVEDVDKPRHR